MAFSIQKASFWKRLSAWMVDTVLVILLSMTFSLPVLQILNFDTYGQQMTSIQNEYKQQIETQFELDLDIEKSEYENLPEHVKTQYDQATQALNDALGKDETYTKLRADRVSLVVTDACIVLFISILLAHFVLPLLLKNGQTLGKKVFGLATVRTNGVKVSPTSLFIRSLVGLYAIETMAVAFFLLIYPVGVIAAILVQVLQIGVMIKTPTNSSIHDLLADTVVVDFASQRIFETQEEREEYLAKLAQEELSEHSGGQA